MRRNKLLLVEVEVSAADDKKSAREARHYQQRKVLQTNETFLSPAASGNSSEISVGNNSCRIV